MACGCNGMDGSNSKAESVVAAPSKAILAFPSAVSIFEKGNSPLAIS